MIVHGWCRNQINTHIGRICHVFKWATSEELLPVAVYHSLGPSNRSNAIEREAVKPVEEEYVEATLPFLNRCAALEFAQAVEGSLLIDRKPLAPAPADEVDASKDAESHCQE
jgi:hypothetical protein